MGKSNTKWGAYDTSLEIEINRILNQLKDLGIRNATKLEATALIAEKNKRAKMSVHEVREFFAVLRGLK
jgi:hypothetical protein